MKRFRRVNVEITNACNLQCDFCPEVERPKQAMAPGAFRRVMAEVAPLTDEVCLHLMGEPLGHPAFAEILAICAEVGVPVNLTTNGLLLTGARRALVLSPIVRQINFSVHSFAANFPHRDPMPYLQKVFAFVHDACVERPDLYVNFRLWDHAPGDDGNPRNDRVRDLIAAEFGPWLKGMPINLAQRKSYNLKGRVYVNFDSQFAWPSLAAPQRSERGTCHGLSSHIGVLADGTVVPCCLDKEGDLRLGNILSSGDGPDPTLNEILSGPRATSMREGFRQGELREAMCRGCDFIKRFDKKAVVSRLPRI